MRLRCQTTETVGFILNKSNNNPINIYKYQTVADDDYMGKLYGRILYHDICNANPIYVLTNHDEMLQYPVQMNTYSESVELHRSYETAATPGKPEGANLSELILFRTIRGCLL